tara:strand:- start:324 stop:527 length:204 start_codon:yes stop_codon:yes gene_type:complete
MTKPINIQSRNLANGRPPQPKDNPPLKNMPASSFDEYCGHMENANYFRQFWRKSVNDYKYNKSKNTK